MACTPPGEHQKLIRSPLAMAALAMQRFSSSSRASRQADQRLRRLSQFGRSRRNGVPHLAKLGLPHPGPERLGVQRRR